MVLLYLLTFSFAYLCLGEMSTVRTLDLEKYSGRWYQMYGNNFDQLFEKYSSCITADYTPIPNGNVSVLNSQIEKNNNLVQIEGYAYYSASNINPKLFPGQLTVHLDGVSFDSPYWVYDLGPIVNNLYDWSLVSDPFKFSLFVLARDVETYYKLYDEDIKTLLTNYGFDTIVSIEHKGCVYAPFPKNE